MMDIKNVLVPVHFSLRVSDNIEYAKWIVDHHPGAVIHLLNVIDCKVVESPRKIHLISKEELRKKMVKKVRQRMNLLIEQYHMEEYDVRPMIRSGIDYLEILNAADDVEAELIIMRSCGRKGLGHLLFGSTSEKVVRLAKCPVLVIKSPMNQ